MMIMIIMIIKTIILPFQGGKEKIFLQVFIYLCLICFVLGTRHDADALNRLSEKHFNFLRKVRKQICFLVRRKRARVEGK